MSFSLQVIYSAYSSVAAVAGRSPLLLRPLPLALRLVHRLPPPLFPLLNQLPLLGRLRPHRTGLLLPRRLRRDLLAVPRLFAITRKREPITSSASLSPRRRPPLRLRSRSPTVPCRPWRLRGRGETVKSRTTAARRSSRSQRFKRLSFRQKFP